MSKIVGQKRDGTDVLGILDALESESPRYHFSDTRIRRSYREWHEILRSNLPALIRESFELGKNSGEWLVDTTTTFIEHGQHGVHGRLAVRLPIERGTLDRREDFRALFCSLFRERHFFWLALQYPEIISRDSKGRYQSYRERYDWLRRHLREGRELANQHGAWSDGADSGSRLSCYSMLQDDLQYYAMFIDELAETGEVPHDVLSKVFHEVRNSTIYKGCRHGAIEFLGSGDSKTREIVLTIGQYRPYKLKSSEISLALAFDAAIGSERGFFVPTPSFYQSCIAPNIRGLQAGSPVEWARSTLAVAHGWGATMVGRDYELADVEKPFLSLARVVGNYQAHIESTKLRCSISEDFVALIGKFIDVYPAQAKPEVLWLMVKQGYDWSRLVLNSERGREQLCNFGNILTTALDRGFRIERLYELLQYRSGERMSDLFDFGIKLVCAIYCSSKAPPWWFKEDFELFSPSLSDDVALAIAEVAPYAFEIVRDIYGGYHQTLTELGVGRQEQLALYTRVAEAVGWADLAFAKRAIDYVVASISDCPVSEISSRISDALLTLDLLETSSASELLLRGERLNLLGLSLSSALEKFTPQHLRPELLSSGHPELKAITICVDRLTTELEERKQIFPRILPLGSIPVRADSLTSGSPLLLTDSPSKDSALTQASVDESPVARFNKLHRVFSEIFPDSRSRISSMMGYLRHFAPYLEDPFNPPLRLVAAFQSLNVLQIYDEDDFDRIGRPSNQYFDCSWREDRDLERRTVIAGLLDLRNDGVLSWDEVFATFNWLRGEPRSEDVREVEIAASFDAARVYSLDGENFEQQLDPVLEKIRRELSGLYGWSRESPAKTYAFGQDAHGNPVLPSERTLERLRGLWAKVEDNARGNYLIDEEDEYRSVSSLRMLMRSRRGEEDERESRRVRRAKKLAASSEVIERDPLIDSVSRSIEELRRHNVHRRASALSDAYAFRLILESPAFDYLLGKDEIRNLVRLKFINLLSASDRELPTYFDDYERREDDEQRTQFLLGRLSTLIGNANLRSSREATLLGHFIDRATLSEQLSLSKSLSELEPLVAALARIQTPLADLGIKLLGVGDVEPDALVKDSVSLMHQIVKAGEIPNARSIVRRTIPLRQVVCSVTDNALVNFGAVMKHADGLIEYLKPIPRGRVSRDMDDSTHAIVASAVTSRLLFALRQKRHSIASAVVENQDIDGADLTRSVGDLLFPARISLDDVVASLKDARDIFISDLKAARMDSFGLLPVGGKIHVTKPVDSNLLNHFKVAVRLGETPFTLQHANRSVLLPVCSSPFEMREILAFLKQEGIIADEVPELQVGISRRIPVQDCAFLGSIVLLGSPRIFQYDAESFATKEGRWDNEVGKRIMSYDDDPRRKHGGNSNVRIPFTDLGGGRTDMLGRRDLWDVQAFQRVGTVINHGCFGGDFAPLAKELKERIGDSLASAGISHVLNREWIWDRTGTLTPEMGRQHFREVIEPCLIARNQSDYHFEQTGETIGVYKDLNDVITWLTGAMRPIQDEMLASPKYQKERELLFFMD